MSLVLDGSAGVTFPTGSGTQGAQSKVLQVVSVPMTNTFSTTSSSFTNITGLSATITPLFSTSKILIIAQVSSSGMNGNSGIFRLAGGNATSYVGNASSGLVQGVVGGYWQQNLTNLLLSQSMIYVDSPTTTSSTTYTVQCTVGGSSGNPVQINYSIGNGGSNTSVVGASSITLMEIAQ